MHYLARLLMSSGTPSHDNLHGFHAGRSFISPENYVDEYRDLYQRFFVAKYMCEDCTTIDEIIASLEAEVAYLADLKREGFEAIAPVQDGHCDFEKAGGPEWGRPYAN